MDELKNLDRFTLKSRSECAGLKADLRRGCVRLAMTVSSSWSVTVPLG